MACHSRKQVALLRSPIAKATIWRVRRHIAVHNHRAWSFLRTKLHISSSSSTSSGVAEEQRLQTIRRYEERQAKGERFSGRPPKTPLAMQQHTVSQLLNVWEAVAYLFQQFHQLLDVVIIDATSASGLLSAPDRQAELETLVSLLFPTGCATRF